MTQLTRDLVLGSTFADRMPDREERLKLPKKDKFIIKTKHYIEKRTRINQRERQRRHDLNAVLESS